MTRQTVLIALLLFLLGCSSPLEPERRTKEEPTYELLGDTTGLALQRPCNHCHGWDYNTGTIILETEK